MRTAVVGVGYLGRFHAQKHMALGTLKFVCDVSLERATSVAEELQCQGITDPKALIGQVDAVTVAADTTTHFELCKMFLKNGIHVFVEKPICSTVAEAQQLVQIADEKQLKLQVGHIERFNPAYAVGQPLVKSPKYIHIQRLAPFKPRSLNVDVVLDLMIHDLDLASHLAGSEVKEIRAKSAKIITPFNDACDAWITFANGVEAFLQCSRIDQRTYRAVQVYGERDVLLIDLGSHKVQRFKKGPVETQPLLVEDIEVTKWDAMLKETEAFLDSIKNGSRVVVGGIQGLEALRSAERILELTR